MENQKQQAGTPSESPFPVTRCKLCDEPAVRRCGRCKLTFYCCREHQMNDWPSHKKECGKFYPKEVPSSVSFPKGCRVRLHSLNRAELNGSEGTMLESNQGLAKGTVKLDGGDKHVLVPVANLVPLDQECPICFETRPHSMMAFFPCGHATCNDCTDRQVVLYGRSCCPICRQETPKSDLMVRTIPVWDQGDKLCFVYTDGFFRQGFPEVLIVDVPIEKVPVATMIMHCVKEFYYDAGKEIVHGHKFGINGVKAQFLTVSNMDYYRRIKPLLGQANPITKFIIVKPRDETMEPDGEWGSIPAAPGGKDAMRERICGKWIKQLQPCSTGPTRSVDDTRGFSRFTDSSRNQVVAEVSIKQVFENRDWVTDWDARLTTEEVTYVQENWNLVLRYFISFVSRYPDLNKLERYVENIAANARDAQSRYNRGLRLAVDP